MAEKKLKKLSKKAAGKKGGPTGAARSVMESANQIWLAGLGAFAKAQEEGGRIFDALVQEGMALEERTRQATSGRVKEVRGAVEGTVAQVQARANQSWDKLEQVFEERVARALGALGVPTAKDVQELTRRVEQLQATVDAYSESTASPGTESTGTPAAAAAPKPAPVTATAASGTTSKKKTTRKKAARKKAGTSSSDSKAD